MVAQLTTCIFIVLYEVLIEFVCNLTTHIMVIKKLLELSNEHDTDLNFHECGCY
jgi:hypothetical protein